MKIHKGKGAPTINTVGAIGDRYVDTDTGNQYRCTFSYSTGSQSEYGWKLMKEAVDIPKNEPEVSVMHIDVVEEPAVTPVVEIEPIVTAVSENAVETVKENVRTNYRQHYDKRRK